MVITVDETIRSRQCEQVHRIEHRRPFISVRVEILQSRQSTGDIIAWKTKVNILDLLDLLFVTE